jgi:hypothetical protein
VLARVILAYLVALPFFVDVAATRSGGEALLLTMSVSTPGVLQVFFDTGAGFSEQQSVIVPTTVSASAHVYRLPIAAGQYRHLRIDPGLLAGRYTIERAALVGSDGSTRALLPLSQMRALQQVTIVEQSDARLVVEAIPGAFDPQLLFAPSSPLDVPQDERIPHGTLRRLLFIWAGSLALVIAVEYLFRRSGDRLAHACRRVWVSCVSHPTATVLLTAAVATLLATYPLTVLGRSLVSPNNGSLRLLYDWIPGAPSSADDEVEDTRASDVSAALYAFVPYSNVQRQALREGEWPLWNRYNGGGRPLWGQGQTFFFDPLHWLTLVTPDPALGWDLKFIAHRFVFATGVGLAALVATGGLLPAAIAAFGAPFVGVYAFRVSHPGTFAMTYAPWALLGWFLLAGAKRPVERLRAALLLAIAMFLLLVASPPKEAMGSMLAVSAAGVLTVLLTTSEWRDKGQQLVAATAAGVLFVLLAAPHWMIFVDTLRQSVTNYDVPYAEIGGLPDFLGLFLSPLTPGPVRPGIHALGLLLIVAALVSPRELLRSPAALACLVAAAVCLSVAFGVVPVKVLLETPLISRIGHIHDVFITAAVPLLLVLSAAGAAALRSGGVVRPAIVTLVLGLSGAWFVARIAALTPHNGFEPWGALFTLTPAAMLPIVFAAARAEQVRNALAAALGVVVLVLPGGLHARSGLTSLDAVLVQPRARVALDANSPAVDTMHRLELEPARAFGTEFILTAGSQALYEVEGLGGPDALANRRYDDLINAAGMWRSDWLTRVGVHDVPRLSPLLDMLNAGFLFTVPENIPVGFHEIAVSGRDRLKLGRRDTAWPRAFFVDGVTQYSDPADLLRQVAAAQHPLAAVEVGDREAVDATRTLTNPTGRVAAARHYRLTTNSTSFVVAADSPGVVVLDETFMAGDFVATLNGRKVPYFRVNHVFKGAAIPSPGTWRVKFEYRPVRWRESLAIAAFGLIITVAVAILARPRRSSTTAIAAEVR